jgi:hypothetical protein
MEGRAIGGSCVNGVDCREVREWLVGVGESGEVKEVTEVKASERGDRGDSK